jgi:serine O-acetyltransferase
VPLSSESWSDDTARSSGRPLAVTARSAAPRLEAQSNAKADNAAGEAETWDLPQLVAALHEARRTQHDWQKAEPERRMRPSRAALIEIVEGLRAALFPSHFGVSDLSDASIDFFVGNTLDTTLRALEEQVRRSLSHNPGEIQNDVSVARRSRALVSAFARSLPGVRRALELDIRAAYEGDPAAQSRSEVIFCYPGISAVFHHRLAHELYRLGLRLLARVVSELAHSTTGIDIHPGAQIGPSFFIDHGTGVVIGETSVIGAHVRLYQGVTLGARNFPQDEHGAAIKGKARHPIIEDDVVIYAGATILGRITIGRGSSIGGNVWLTRGVPAGSQVTQAQTKYANFKDGGGI